MKEIIRDTQFKRDLKLLIKRNKDISKLTDIIDKIFNDEKLPAKNKDHNLIGIFKDCRECHIEPDWLLIYSINGDVLHLIRTGTHADLFE